MQKRRGIAGPGNNFTAIFKHSVSMARFTAVTARLLVTGLLWKRDGWQRTHFTPQIPTRVCVSHHLSFSPQVRSLPPAERQQALENMDAHLGDFVTDSRESALFTVTERQELQREVDDCRKHCQSLFVSMETGKWTG